MKRTVVMLTVANLFKKVKLISMFYRSFKFKTFSTIFKKAPYCILDRQIIISRWR